jgi:four helix bundle protein
VGARSHRELEVWQLANEVRQRIFDLSGRERVQRDFGFCDQANRAASSACHNIAEGFYRFSDREFSHFLNIAYGSLGELLDLTDEARQKAYLDDAGHDDLNVLIGRGMAAVRALRRHLASKHRPSP